MHRTSLIGGAPVERNTGAIVVGNPMLPLAVQATSQRRLGGNKGSHSSDPPMDASDSSFRALDAPRPVSVVPGGSGVTAGTTIPNPARPAVASRTPAAGKTDAPHPAKGCGICKRRDVVVEDRIAHLNTPELKYGNNYISTSKYSWWSFVPRSLFEQFRRIANVYFLGISALMLLGTYVPEIFESPLSAYSTLGPLCLVLAITMIKEGAEDYKRHRSDYQVNNRMCAVLQGDGSEKEVAWKDLRVGMVIKINNRGEVPADVIALQTSEPRGACYVETSNIDGETNLKLKEAVAVTALAAPREADVGKLTGEMEYEGPNDRIHTFTGRVRVGGSGAHVPVGARNMALRGCTLRNTKWMLGLVVYSGADTKVMKKSGGARSKMSQVEKTMNMCIKVIFAAQFVLCTIATIALVLWNAQFSDNYPYLYSSSTVFYIPSWLGQWFTFLVLFNNFIPISLYVTVELVNYAQAWLIDQDAAMWDPVSDTPAKARTSNLNQDLGQIEYVFSDKTGTLTRNVMEFKLCSVAGSVFGVFVPEAEAPEEVEADSSASPNGQSKGSGPSGWCGRGANQAFRPHTGSNAPGRDATTVELSPGSRKASCGAGAQPALKSDNPFHKSAGGVGSAAGGLMSPRTAEAAVGSGFDDPLLLENIRYPLTPGALPGYGANWTPEVAERAATMPTHPSEYGESGGGVSMSPESRICMEAFFACMSVCHTVVPETDEKNPTGPPIYQAESPDEGALTKAAREMGFEFYQRNSDSIVVRRWLNDHFTPYRFEIFGVHEFNSTRKRMATVCQGPDGRILLMVKGADNVMFERAVPDSYRAKLESDLTEFASVGLRTLVLGQRELSRPEFEAWQREYTEASVSLVDREAKLAAVAEKYEVNLHVLGSTAIEDRLQDGVPGTIRDLARAGIKTWVLTGDKVETAINIGFSCRLLDASMEMIQIVAEDEPAIRKQLAELEKRFLPLVRTPQTFLEKLLRRGRGESETTLPVPVTGIAANKGKGGSSGAMLTHPPPATRPTGSVQGGGVGGAASGNPMSTHHSSGSSGQGHQQQHSAGGSLRLHTDMAVVVTGLALTHILGKRDAEQAFLTVARCCRAVIACRVSPQQKALIVRLVRKGISPSPMTLAIGDGANDVGMIQRAEVGVGISGKEGLQAVNSADFAIAQFRFLRRLLLVHGRWDYRRMTKVVLYSFYKNVVITLSLFYFTALTGFSGTSFYESNVYSTYNFVLGLPIIFCGILDRDVSAKTALEHPSVYSVGLRYADLNIRKILTWIAWALLHSVIVFWLVYGVMGPIEQSWSTTGVVDGLSAAGLTQFNTLVWAMQFEVCMQTITWTWINFFVLGLSMGVFYLFLIGYSQLDTMSPDFYGVASQAFSRADYWLVILLMFAVMMLLDYTVELLRRMHFANLSDIAMERDRGYGTAGKDGRVAWDDDETNVSAATGATGGSAGGAATVITSITVHPAVGSAESKGTGASRNAAPTTATAQSHGAGMGDSRRLLASASGAYQPPTPNQFRGYVDVPHGAVLDGLTPQSKGKIGVSDAHTRSAYDYSYASGKPSQPISPYVSDSTPNLADTSPN